MQSKRRFIVRLLALTSVIVSGLVTASLQQTSAWPYSNTRALVFSGFPGEENGALGGQSVTDADHNLIMLGGTAGTVQVDPANPSTLFGDGTDGIEFLTKYSPRGDYMWGVQWSDLSGDLDLTDVAVNPEGDIFVVGTVATAGADIDPSASGTRLVPNANSGVVLKFSATGALTWARDFSATSSLSVNNLGLSPNGSLVVGGNFEGTLNLDGPGGASGMTFTSGARGDFFVVSLDSSGVEQWAVTGSSADPDSVAALEVLGNGDILIATPHRDPITLRSASGVVTVIDPLSLGTTNSLIWKLSSAGESIWTTQPIADTGTDETPRHLVVRNNGELILSINTNYLLVLSSSGSKTSVLQTGGEIADLEALSSGAIAIAGEFRSTVDLDPTSGVDNRTSTDPSYDVFVTLLTSSLSYNSTRVYPTIGPNYITDVSVDNDGGWIVTGWTLVSSSLSLSTTSETATFEPASGADTMNFIVRYQADGSTAVPVPASPTTASYAPGNRKATLQWTAMPHAARYVVTRAGTTVCDTTTTSCDVTGLRNGRFTTFSISAYNYLNVASPTSTSVRAMGGFLVKGTTWKAKRKPKLSSIVTTTSRGTKSWRVKSGACRISGSRLVMPTKPGRCRLQMRVAKKRTYSAMSTTVVVSVTRR